MSAPATAQARTTREFRIAELIKRFKAVEHGGKWRVLDGETRDFTPPTYTDEAMAKAGARLTAACTIIDYFEGRAR